MSAATRTKLHQETARVLRGSCLCGRVMFETTGDPLIYHTCFCDCCRKASGSAFMAIAFFKIQHFTLVSGQDVIKTYGDGDTITGNIMSRSFCGECGAPMWLQSPLREGCILVNTGAYDDHHEWVPNREWFPHRKDGWIKDILVPIEKTML
ncbi:DUF636 domain-containing protein [Fistulina hepatica ATCC 64428]|uniref:DUF636 domain-containing protein n=1 Tax=Fistulina hepatica ATCC 64428 TaxID=1128425 RepID=A0A0D7A8C0_9AGAR|nr:DUF636 domain-containing protein [Fistulina hepatica ATCC 64428]